MDRDAEYEKVFNNLGYIDTDLDDAIIFLANADDILESMLGRNTTTKQELINKVQRALGYIKKAELNVFSAQSERDNAEDAATNLQTYE